MRSSTSYHQDKSWCKGVTLIELLVAVVILGIAAGLAAPNLSRWTESYTVRKAGRQLVSDLQLAKMKSVSQGLQHRISFDAANKTYTIEQGNASSGSTTWSQVDVVRALANEQNPYYAKGVTLASNFANNTVLFSPLGTASPAGTVTFATANYTRNVRVVLTGRVRLD
jgi:prepilin-type N-terminal cleavage/methylation domain-containing protein